MLAPGTKIDSYTVIDCIGAGGYGNVYKCSDSELNRIVALKLLAADMITSEESRERFEREAKILCTIKHAHVTRCYRTGMYDATTPYIAMEFIEGRSLRSIIDEKTVVPWQSVVDYALQMCDALTEIHHHGIIHRDLKPDNFMLSNDGVLKLVDFGLARVSGTATLTETGLLLGTVYYMSPEACIGQKVDERADIYSLGCTLFFALFGRPPFDAATPLAIIHQHANAEIEIPTSQLVPASLANIVLRCLAKNPDNRFQSTQQLASALKQIQENAGELYKPKSKRKIAWPLVAIGSAVLAAILLPSLTRLNGKVDNKTVFSKGAPTSHKIPQRMRLLEELESIGKLANSSFLTNEDKVGIFRDYVSSDKNKNPLFLGMVWHRLGDFEQDNPKEEFHCKEQAAKYLQLYLATKPDHNKNFRSACIDSAESLIFTGRYADAQKALNSLEVLSDESIDGSLGRVFETQHQAHLYAGTGQMRKCELALKQEQKALAVKNTLLESTLGGDSRAEMNKLLHSDSVGTRSSECAARQAFLLAVQGRVDDAQNAAKSAMEYSKQGSINGVDRMSALGDKLMMSDYSVAECAYREFLRPGKSHWLPPTQLKLINCLLLQKKFTEANLLLESLPAMKPDHPLYVELLKVKITCGDLQGKDTEELCAKLKQINSEPGQINRNGINARIDAWFTLVQHYRTAGNTVAMKDALASLSAQLKDLPFSFRTDDALLLLLDAEMPEQMLDLCDSVVVDPKSQLFTELQLYRIQALALQNKTEQVQLLLNKISVGAAEVAPRVNAKLLYLKALYATASKKEAITLLTRALTIYETDALIVCPDHFFVLKAIVHLAKEESTTDLLRQYEQKLATLSAIKNRLPLFGNAGQLPLWRG